VALLAAISSGSSALAVEWIVSTGDIETAGITLGTGDALTNNGTITRPIGAPVNYGGIGTISVIHNTQTGTISGNATPAINIGGNLTRFENNGLIASDGTEGLVVFGTLGSFLNTGTMSNVNDRTVAVYGFVDSFANSGTITGASTGNNGETVRIAKGVGKFVNTGTIVNTNSLGPAAQGHGVSLDISLATGGAVGSFENRGNISSDLSVPNGNGSGVIFQGVISAYQVGSFVNSGTITGIAYGVNSMGGFGSFTNARGGVINGSLYSGVWADHSVGRFSNAGSISGRSAGVTIDGDVGTFSNSGTISSERTGIYISGDTGTFSNSGQISGSHTGFVSDGFVSNFSNSGTIQGDTFGVRLSGFGTALNSGSIVGTSTYGVRIDQPGGTFTNSGVINGADAAIAYALGSSGANTLINSGTLIGTNGVAVDFGRGSDGDDTLRLLTGSRIEGDIRFGGGHDVLDVSGFTGNAVLRATGFDVLLTGDNLFYYNPADDQIAIIDKTGITAPGTVVGRDVSLDLHNVVASQLSSLGTRAAQDEAVSNYAPIPAQSAAAQAIGANADRDPSRAVWSSLIGGGSRDDTPVAISNLFGGIVAGSHARINDNTTLGILGSYVAGNLDINNGGHSVRTNTGVLGVYGRSELGIVDLDYALLGGLNGHHSERHIVNLGRDETALADYGSWFVSPSVGLAVPVLTTSNGELRVASRLSYVGGRVEGYDEAGSNVNLSVGSQQIGVVDARFGLDGTIWSPASAGLEVTFTANAGLFVQSNLGGTATPVSFLGQTQEVAAAGTTTYGIYAGMALSVMLSNTLKLNTSLDGQSSNDGLLTGTVTAGLSASF